MKSHVLSGDGVLCGDSSVAAMASDLCKRCGRRVDGFVAALATIAATETVGAVACAWCDKDGGSHFRSCPREVAARALGYKSLDDYVQRSAVDASGEPAGGG